MTEAAFQSVVLDIAAWRGWLAYHTRDSRGSRSGFPDLVLVRERVVYAELKRDKGKPSLEQIKWISALREADGEAYVWFPCDMDEIERVLAKS